MPDYDPFAPGPIQPLGVVGQYLRIDTGSGYKAYQIRYVEPLSPGGEPGAEGVLAVNIAAAAIAAAGRAAPREMTELAVDDYELLHLRWAVMTPRVSCRMFYPRSVGRQATYRQLHARRSAASRLLDPDCALSTFFVYGNNQNVYIEIFNASATAVQRVLAQFWGFHYLVRAAEEWRSGMPATLVPVVQPSGSLALGL